MSDTKTIGGAIFPVVVIGNNQPMGDRPMQGGAALPVNLFDRDGNPLQIAQVQDNSGNPVENAVIETGEASPPASYSTGGFAVDLSTRFSNILFADLTVETPGSLMPVRPEISRNVPGAGQFRVLLRRTRYDRAGTIGNITGQPVGVTVQGTSGAQVASDGGHTHASGGAHAGHGQVSPTDAALASVGGADSQGAQHEHDASAGAHTHDAIAAHQHLDNNIYQHGHTPTLTETDGANTEVAAGTNLSTTVFRYMAIGVKR